MKRRTLLLAALPTLALTACPAGPVPDVECSFEFPRPGRVSSSGGFNILLNVKGSFTSEELPAVRFFSDVEASGSNYPEGLLLESAINTAVDGGCAVDGCPAGGRLETAITPGTHVITAQALTPSGQVACEPTVTIEANAPPSLASITIAPASPVTGDSLSFTFEANDPEGDPVQVTSSWRSGDQTVAGETLASINTEAGEEWTLTLTPRDDRDTGVASTATVTIGNTAPVAPEVVIGPTPARENSDIVCAVTNLDEVDPDDAQTLSVNWSWTRDGSDAGIDTAFVPASAQGAGEEWTCSATVSDGTDTGPAASASVVVAEVLGAPASLSASSLQAVDGGSLQRLGSAGRIAAFRDLDGDGLADFVLLDNSSVNAGNGSAHAWVFSGADVNAAAGNLSTTDAAADIVGPAGHDFDTVWEAGDLNGDGLSDIAIGFSDFLPGPTSTGIFLVFGDEAGLPAIVDAEDDAVVIYGGSSVIGATPCAVGDLDGDGIDELAMAAPTSDALSGAVFITYGHVGAWPSGLYATDLLPGFRLEGSTGLQQLGTSCAGPIDLDADGYDDLVVGAPGAGSAGNGRVLVYKGDGTRWSGSQTSATADAIVDAGASSNGGFGIAMAALGDHDGDGMGDFAVWGNGPDGESAFAGAVWIASGGDPGFTGALSTSALPYTVDGLGELGFCRVMAGGDLDGDGLGDLACGDSNPAFATEPAMRVFFGSGSLVAERAWDDDDLRVVASSDDNRTGASLAWVPDIDANDYGELLIGVPDEGLVEDGNGTAVNAPGEVLLLDLATLTTR